MSFLKQQTLFSPAVPARTEPAEVTVRQFSKITGISRSRIHELCDSGDINFRYLTTARKSKKLIPRSQIERFKNITE